MNEQIHKYFLGELNERERAALLNQVEENEELQKEFVRQQNLHALLDLYPNQDDTATGRRSYQMFTSSGRKKTTTGNIFLRIAKYAAAIAILITSTWWITHTAYQQEQESELNTLYVPPGQRARLTLHDGTTVWLNAKSTLTYPARFAKDKREVSLLGEAFFDVEKNTSAPFTVNVKETEIKVLGTEFNVHGYPEADYIQTSLLTGSVEITTAGENKTITLSPNQQATVTGGKTHVDKIRQQAYFLWKDGIYSFEQETFGSIIKKLELYYDTKIVVKDKEILDFVYTGKFRQQDGIDEILRIIQKIHNFKINRDRENNIITLKK